LFDVGWRRLYRSGYSPLNWVFGLASYRTDRRRQEFQRRIVWGLYRILRLDDGMNVALGIIEVFQDLE
jgi:hypothetical protein